MRARVARCAVLLLLPLALSGCIYGNPDIDNEFGAVEWELRPLHLEPHVELRVGSGMIGLARMAADWSDDPDAEFAAEILRDIDAVHVGVYELDGRRRDAPSDFGPQWREELADLGWRMVVRSRESGEESGWVFTRDLDEVLIVGLGYDEVVLVKLDGDMGAVLDRAIRREDGIVMAARNIE